MKPARIILIRHGESEGNIDRNTYAVKQDYKLLLTEEGKKQATEAGRKLRELVSDESIMFYVSPLWRTRMTFEYLARDFNTDQYQVREDPRLREQEWGHYRDLKMNVLIDDERNKFGTFYYRIKDGESCADVYDRMSDFLQSIYREFEKPGFPKNLVLVTHGMALRIFLMRWFHWTVEEFEELRNPKNAQMVVMELDPHYNKYRLLTDLKKKNTKPDDQYTWSVLGKDPNKKNDDIGSA